MRTLVIKGLDQSLDGQQPRRGPLPMLMSYVPEAARPRVIAVTVQEVVAAIKASGRHGWIAEFEEKYGLVKPTPP